MFFLKALGEIPSAEMKKAENFVLLSKPDNSIFLIGKIISGFLNLLIGFCIL